MMLSQAENERFYRAWFGLLYYANEKLKLTDHVPRGLNDGVIAPSEAFKIREAVWADDTLRAAFIAENPAELPPEDLALVKSWDARVAGSFYIERHLKKYSIFISEGTPERVFGVLGLSSPIKEIAPPYLPIYVQATLVPFEDRIVYDGLLAPYNLYFGPGIRANLKETYRAAQERGQIITSLVSAPTDVNEILKDIRPRNTKLLNTFRRNLASSSLSMKMIDQHVSNIEAFANFLADQPLPRGVLDLTTIDLSSYVADIKLPATARKTLLTSLKRFVRFLFDTRRLENDPAWELLDFLKHYES